MTPDISNFSASILPYVINIGILVAMLVFLIIGAVFILKYAKYWRRFTTTVIIYSRRMMSETEINNIKAKLTGKDPKLLRLPVRFEGKVFTDKGAWISRKDGTEFFRLKKLKVNIEPPDYPALAEATKGNYLILQQIANDEFLPIYSISMLETGHQALKVGDKDIDFWRATQLIANRNTFGKPSMWEKFLPYGIIALTVIGALLIIYTIVQLVQDVVPALNNVANALTESAKLYAQATSQASTSASAGVTPPAW